MSSNKRSLRNSAEHSDDWLLAFERFRRRNPRPLGDKPAIFRGAFTKGRSYHLTRRRKGTCDWGAGYRPFVVDNVRGLGTDRSLIASSDLQYLTEVVPKAGEHVMSGIKRCRIVKDELRYFSSTFRDKIFFVACGLHNFRVTRRKNTYSRGALRVRARINLNFPDT